MISVYTEAVRLLKSLKSPAMKKLFLTLPRKKHFAITRIKAEIIWLTKTIIFS